jgi:Xaa-Pro aminopeptidase
MDRVTVKKRVSQIQDFLKKNHIYGLVVTKRANVTYLTGFLGDDSWALVTPRSTYLITDSRYTEQAAKECPGCKIIQRNGPMVAAVAGLIKKCRAVDIIGLEDSTSIAVFSALKRRITSRIRRTTNVVESIREKKDSAEVSAIRKAAKIALQALGRALRQVRRGLTENELAGIIDFELRKSGAGSSFEPVVAFGPNASRPHHRPGRSKLKTNQPILIDWGAIYKGYCSDMTRCFAFGKITRSYTRAYKAVCEAQQAAISKLRAGVLIAEVDKAAREVINSYGLPVYGHGTGHGIGLEIHEGPVISGNVKGKLEAGQVVTIEPGVYIPGRLGVRIEDDFLITERGCRRLSDEKYIGFKGQDVPPRISP